MTIKKFFFIRQKAKNLWANLCNHSLLGCAQSPNEDSSPNYSQTSNRHRQSHREAFPARKHDPHPLEDSSRVLFLATIDLCFQEETLYLSPPNKAFPSTISLWRLANEPLHANNKHSRTLSTIFRPQMQASWRMWKSSKTLVPLSISKCLPWRSATCLCKL